TWKFRWEAMETIREYFVKYLLVWRHELTTVAFHLRGWAISLHSQNGFRPRWQPRRAWLAFCRSWGLGHVNRCFLAGRPLFVHIRLEHNLVLVGFSTSTELGSAIALVLTKAVSTRTIARL